MTTGATSAVFTGLSYLGLVLLVGPAVFWYGVWPAGRRLPGIAVVTWFGWSLSLIGTAGLLSEEADAAGGLFEALAGRSGTALAARIALLAIAAAWLVDHLHGRAQSDMLAVLLLVGLIESWVFAGTAVDGRYPAVGAVLDTVHLLATTIWLGGLTTLALAAVRLPAVRLRHVWRRFPQVAAVSLSALSVTGAGQAWLHRPDGGTDARLVLAKAAGLVVMVLIAVVGGRVIRPATGAGPAEGVAAALAGARGGDDDWNRGGDEDWEPGFGRRRPPLQRRIYETDPYHLGGWVRSDVPTAQATEANAATAGTGTATAGTSTATAEAGTATGAGPLDERTVVALSGKALAAELLLGVFVIAGTACLVTLPWS